MLLGRKVLNILRNVNIVPNTLQLQSETAIKTEEYILNIAAETQLSTDALSFKSKSIQIDSVIIISEMLQSLIA